MFHGAKRHTSIFCKGRYYAVILHESETFINAKQLSVLHFFTQTKTLKMKRQIKLLLLLFFLQRPTVTTLLAQGGLIAYYPFKGNAQDETGNGYNGTVYGATLCDDIDGEHNIAVGHEALYTNYGSNNTVIGYMGWLFQYCWFRKSIYRVTYGLF